MIGADAAVVLLTGSLLLSLIIERLLELARAGYDVVEARRGSFSFWNDRAARLQARMHAALEQRAAGGRDRANQARLQTVLRRLGPSGSDGSVPVICAAKLRRIWIRNVCMALGMLLGIGAALAADLNLFALVEMHMTGVPANELADAWRFGSGGIWLTGIAMGLGSGPLHKMIVALEHARNRRLEAAELQ